MPAILAKKLGMTQLFLEDGRVERVTVLEAGPCPVTGIRTHETDGYAAVQLAYGATKEKHLSKPELGHLRKADAAPHRHLVEFRDESRLLDRRHRHRGRLRARPEGQGRRHLEGQGLPGHDQAPRLRRGPKSHGSHNVRAPGSIGASAWPARVMKGIRGPGQMGNKRITQKGLTIVQVDAERTCCSSAAPSPARATAWWRCARMPSAPVLSTTGERPLDETAFGAAFHGPLVHESVRAELNARRQGTHSTKTRGNVRGGGAKPWRQKGTGRARAGSSRSPIWTGGGTIFGPQPRHYTFKVNRKERRAFRSALSVHAERGTLAVFDTGAFDGPVDQARRQARARQGVNGASRGRVLVILTDADRDAALSFRNLAQVRGVIAAEGTGVADLIGAANVLASQSAVDELTARAKAQSRSALGCADAEHEGDDRPVEEA